MTLSKREKMIAVVTATVVGLLILNMYVIGPLMDAREELAAQELRLTREINDARALLKESREANRRWPELRKSGLTSDQSTAASSLLNAMESWSLSAGLPLSSMRPDRSNTVQGLHDLTYQATADGSMRAIVGFLYRAETAQMPARIRELQITSRTDGADDLSMQLRMSTIWEDAKSRENGKEKAQP